MSKKAARKAEKRGKHTSRKAEKKVKRKTNSNICKKVKGDVVGGSKRKATVYKVKPVKGVKVAKKVTVKKSSSKATKAAKAILADAMQE